MRRKPGLWLLPAYLKRHVKMIVMLALFVAIFAVIMYLSNLPLDAVLYAGLLSLCVGLAFFASGFVSFCARCAVLERMRARVTLSTQEMPTPRDETERLYTALVQAVHEDKLRLMLEANNLRSSDIEYFTLWAHQIKTPIAATRVLLKPEQAELRGELFKIEQYVDVVLQYLRLDAPAGDLVLRRYDLDGIIRRAVRKYSPAFIRKKIALSYDGVDALVLTDEKWLGFVIEQLLSNALKYTPGGTVTIRMDDDKPLTLLIEDTGVGIRPEDIPRVFEKGYTGYNGRGGRQSTGIGLYLCRRIAGILSHGISITSRLGEGTSVRLDLASEDIRHE